MKTEIRKMIVEILTDENIATTKKNVNLTYDCLLEDSGDLGVDVQDAVNSAFDLPPL
jgi:hypothetical protein